MSTMNLLKTNSSATGPSRLARLADVAALLGGATAGALAQYKIVGPDGKPRHVREARVSRGYRISRIKIRSSSGDPRDRT